MESVDGSHLAKLNGHIYTNDDELNIDSTLRVLTMEA